MIDISVNKINKYYGANHVIKDVSFEINSGERVGLLGKNGSGKTTLFKVITGEEFYESGSVARASNKRIEMLAQIPTFGEEDTCEDVLRSSFSEVSAIYHEMKKLEISLTEENMQQYSRLLEKYEQLGGYNTEVELDKICSGMNIDDRLRNSLFSMASGGEKARVNLARVLLHESDILLLDEPTNHLDLVSLEWLETFLQEFKGTVVVISHDRRFLDNVVTRIIELDGENIDFYAGNYSFYVEEKERRRETQAEKYKQQQRKIGQLEAAIKRQRVWMQSNPSNTGLAKRAQAMERRIEQMDKIDKPKKNNILSEEFDSGGYIAKQAVYLENVTKAYFKKIILKESTMNILRNERIALIGENGCGKSTLMKMIMKVETPDSGLIAISPSVKSGYIPQSIIFDDENATVLDTLRYKFGLTEEKSRSILANFNFRAQDVLKKVSVLSGGEKSRLKLCLLMQSNTNFLLLDEPTNHLDIGSREWIETALDNFDGTMLFVSHDRYFLEKFAQKVWHMENGKITIYNGGYNEYIDKKIEKEALENAEKERDTKKVSKKSKKTQNLKEIPKENIDEKIKQLELKIEFNTAEIEGDMNKGDFSKMEKLTSKKWALEKELEVLYDEWLEENI